MEREDLPLQYVLARIDLTASIINNANQVQPSTAPRKRTPSIAHPCASLSISPQPLPPSTLASHNQTMADLHNTPIVIDNGSGTIRAGYAGEDLPKCFFPSFVGRPKHPRVLAGGLEGDVFIGNRAQELRGLLKIRYPLEHGIVTDWDDMERIWQYVYTDELKTLSEEVRS
jgi:hypothetical protein